VIRGFCDESYDKDHRVYSLAGFVGRDKQWNKIARRWRNRCLDDGIRCYHAVDCEGGYGDFKDFSKEQIASLNTDLISILTEEQGIVGVGISIDLADHRLASESSDKARRILGNHPYFMVMECLVSEIAAQINKAEMNYRVAFIFDQQKEFQGRARKLYDNVKEQFPHLAKRMGTLS
jgi:predicted RNA-binding protein